MAWQKLAASANSDSVSDLSRHALAVGFEIRSTALTGASAETGALSSPDCDMDFEGGIVGAALRNGTSCSREVAGVCSHSRNPDPQKTNPRKTAIFRGSPPFLAETEGFEPSIQVLARMLP